MTISHLLEDFDPTLAAAPGASVLDEEALEDFRLGAFEKGYSAGWEDAVSAQDKDNRRISSSLSQNLEDLSFTYQEALLQMTQSVEPVFRTLVDVALPEAMKSAISDHLVAELHDMAADALSQPIVISVPSGAAEAVQALLDEAMSVPVDVVEDSTMPDGQAGIRVGRAEREIDTSRLAETLSHSVDAYFHQITEDIQNGKASDRSAQ